VNTCKVHGLGGVIDWPCKETLVNKVGHLWPTDQVIEYLAEALAVKALRGCGDAEDASVRVMSKHGCPSTGGGVVCFVDNDKVRRHHAVEPTDERLHAGDLREVRAVGRQARSDKTMRHVHLRERAVALLQEFGAVD
jgi:hypothetical protein